MLLLSTRGLFVVSLSTIYFIFSDVDIGERVVGEIPCQRRRYMEGGGKKNRHLKHFILLFDVQTLKYHLSSYTHCSVAYRTNT